MPGVIMVTSAVHSMQLSVDCFVVVQFHNQHEVLRTDMCVNCIPLKAHAITILLCTPYGSCQVVLHHL